MELRLKFIDLKNNKCSTEKNMLASQKFRQYFLLSCLTLAIIVTPTLGETVTLAKVPSSIQIAQTTTVDNTADRTQIKEAILSNEQKYHWRPQVDILAITDGYAIASVHDENTGGESVLKKFQNDWKIVCGTGGAFGKAEELHRHCKVPLATANRLLQIKADHRR